MAKRHWNWRGNGALKRLLSWLLIAAGAKPRLAINTPERRCVWALTADADFLAQRGQGQVEQVFARAVNIALPARQQLLTLLCEEYDNAPNSCRLALTHFDDLSGMVIRFSLTIKVLRLVNIFI